VSRFTGFQRTNLIGFVADAPQNTPSPRRSLWRCPDQRTTCGVAFANAYSVVSHRDDRQVVLQRKEAANDSEEVGVGAGRLLRELLEVNVRGQRDETSIPDDHEKAIVDALDVVQWLRELPDGAALCSDKVRTDRVELVHHDCSLEVDVHREFELLDAYFHIGSALVATEAWGACQNQHHRDTQSPRHPFS
jgi:hypothetical protein